MYLFHYGIEREKLLKKILIIDDEYYSRLLLEEIIEDYNKDIVIISEELNINTFEMIKEEKPDVLFLDVMMPVADGREICRRIKNDPELKNVCVILISARNFEAYSFKNGKYQADAYIQKPFSTKKVIKKMEEVFIKREK